MTASAAVFSSRKTITVITAELMTGQEVIMKSGALLPALQASMNVKILEFYKAHEIFAQAQPAQQQLINELKKARRRYAIGSGCTKS